MNTPNLFPTLSHDVTAPCDGTCTAAVVEHAGRFFVTFGHAGFNSRANNRQGFASAAAAQASIRRFSGKGGAR